MSGLKEKHKTNMLLKKKVLPRIKAIKSDTSFLVVLGLGQTKQNNKERALVHEIILNSLKKRESMLRCLQHK